MDFQSEKSFRKLRLRAFQPYHQFLCMSKHVEDVEDRSMHLRAVMLCMSKTSKILKEAITEFLEFISLLLKMSKINQIHLKTAMLCM